MTILNLLLFILLTVKTLTAAHTLFHDFLNFLLSKIEPHLNECRTQRFPKRIRAAALNNVKSKERKIQNFPDVCLQFLAIGMI